MTDRPVGSVVAQRDYADVLIEEATYQSILDDFATYRDLLTNTRQTSAPDGGGSGATFTDNGDDSWSYSGTVVDHGDYVTIPDDGTDNGAFVTFP